MHINDIIRWVINFGELSALLVGIYYYKSLNPKYWRLLVLLLGIILTTELLSKMFNFGGKQEWSIYVYNFINFPSTIVMLTYLLSRPFDNRKNIFTVGALIYCISFIIELVFIKSNRFGIMTTSYQIGAVFLLVLCLAYFLKMTHSNLILNYKTDMHFWLAIAILAYTVTTLPFSALRVTLYNSSPRLFDFYWKIVMFFSFSMYIILIVGLSLSFKKDNHIDNGS